jgi:malate dehydrogenase (oxaloacetate-decarboxylating)
MVDRDGVLKAHSSRKGKYEILGKVPLLTTEDLATYYTPGVAYVSEEIKADRSKVYEYTTKSNTIAIISDGTRILGLGDVGPEAGLPVMEGKAVLFKKFGGVDAVPICLDTKDEEEIIGVARSLAPTFGAINIEDISSPKSMEITGRLAADLDIPVFHDDNQGSGVVAHAALINALKLVGKGKGARILINGAGAAGIGVARQLINAGFQNLAVFDTKGAIYSGRGADMNKYKAGIAEHTNRERRHGQLTDFADGADVLIGFSARGAFTADMIKRMAEKPIVFALANPDPEIEYEEALEAGAYIAATGRSDRPNQVNNMLAFPGVMRGLLDSRSKSIKPEMLNAAAHAIARCVGKRLGRDYIIPGFADYRTAVKVTSEVAEAVAAEAEKLGQARVQLSKGETKAHTKALLKRYSKIEKRVIGR